MAATEIQVYLDGASWVVRYLGPHAEEIRRLFGTDTIVTTHGRLADPALVESDIRRLHPGVVVISDAWAMSIDTGPTRKGRGRMR